MNKHGFTFVDLIIGITACGIIALVSIFLVMPADNWVFIIERRSSVAEARTAMVQMIREVEHLKSPAQIDVMTPTKIAYVNLDDKPVSFELMGTDILYNGDSVLVRRVQSLVFSYLTAEGAETLINADVRTIGIKLVIPSGEGFIRLQSAIQVKNGVTR